MRDILRYARHSEAFPFLIDMDFWGQYIAYGCNGFFRCGPSRDWCLLLWPFPVCGWCSRSRARRVRALPSEVYPAGKHQWDFTCGFVFRHSLWLPFAATFAVLKGLNLIEKFGLSPRGCFFSREWGEGLSVEFYGCVTKHSYSFQ